MTMAATLSSGTRRACSTTTAGALCLVLSLLTGCHAELDWREFTLTDSQFSVLLPARAHEESRALAGVAGNPVMRLWSAKAADTIFGAGYVDLDRVDDSKLATLRDALVRNIRGSIVSERKVRAATLGGIEFVAEGRIGDARAQLHARLLVSGRRVYQLAAVGRAGALNAADLEMFLESMRLRPSGP
jgi:hypothetical protein